MVAISSLLLYVQVKVMIPFVAGDTSFSFLSSENYVKVL